MNGSEPFHVRKIDHGPADDHDFDELDLLLWYTKTGEILK